MRTTTNSAVPSQINDSRLDERIARIAASKRGMTANSLVSAMRERMTGLWSDFIKAGENTATVEKFGELFAPVGSRRAFVTDVNVEEYLVKEYRSTNGIRMVRMEIRVDADDGMALFTRNYVLDEQNSAYDEFVRLSDSRETLWKNAREGTEAEAGTPTIHETDERIEWLLKSEAFGTDTLLSEVVEKAEPRN